MKYRVMVPPAKTARMQAQKRVVVVSVESGWDSRPQQRFVIHGGDMEVPLEFDVPDDAEPAEKRTVMDGWVFHVDVHYTNSTGTRGEKYRLVAEQVKGRP